MSKYKKLSHVIYYHVYHIVWTPKYRYKIMDGTLKDFIEVQIKLLRHGDERANDRYGKSAPPLRQRACQAHINVSDVAMGEAVS